MEQKAVNYRKWTIVLLIPLLAIGFLLIPTETAKADNDENIPEFYIEFGKITGLQSVIWDYQQVKLIVYNEDTDVLALYRVMKTGDVYWINGLDYTGIAELERILRGTLLLQISGYYADVYNLSLQLKMQSAPEWYMYNTRVYNSPRVSTNIDGLAIAVNELNYTRLNGYTISTTQQYLPNYSYNRLVTKSRAYNEFLQGHRTIYGYIGTSDRYELGYNEGYSKATNSVNKKSASYIQGYQDGLKTGGNYDYSFFGLMASVINAPLEAFNGLFNVEILGTNIRTFLLSMLTIALVVLIIRKFIA